MADALEHRAAPGTGVPGSVDHIIAEAALDGNTNHGIIGMSVHRSFLLLFVQQYTVIHGVQHAHNASLKSTQGNGYGDALAPLVQVQGSAQAVHHIAGHGGRKQRNGQNPQRAGETANVQPLAGCSALAPNLVAQGQVHTVQGGSDSPVILVSGNNKQHTGVKHFFR